MRLDFLGAFDPYLAASRLRTGPSADSFLGNLHIVAFVPQICYRRFGCSQPPLHDHTHALQGAPSSRVVHGISPAVFQRSLRLGKLGISWGFVKGRNRGYRSGRFLINEINLRTAFWWQRLHLTQGGLVDHQSEKWC